MGGKFERYLIPALIGFAPPVLLLLTWAPNGLSHLQNIIRVGSLPVLGVEFFTIALAFAEGLGRSWRNLLPPRYALVALAILFAIAFATAFFVAPDRAEAVSRTIFWLIHLAFGFAVAFLCTRYVRAGDMVGAYLLGFIVFALLFAGFVVTAWARPIDWTYGLPAARHVRHLGYYAAAMAGLSAGLMAIGRDRRAWALGFVGMSLAFGIGLWTGSRGMALASIAAILVAMLLIPSMRRAKAWGGSASAAALGAAAVALLPVPPSGLMGVVRTVTATTQHEVTTGRVLMWRGALGAIWQHPLFGYGEGQMHQVAPFYDMIQPHNILLQVLLAWGAAGLLCMLVLGYSFAVRAVPAVKGQEQSSTPPFVAMLALLALSLVDGPFFYVLPISIFAACAGMIASIWVRGSVASP